MSEWYEKPYPKHPKPPSVKLPRTLYPPKSHKGYYSGDDVVAYRRAVSRLGRWPWADTKSDQYNDLFAFGQSGNVVDTGVKGVQRQSSIDQTGILGEHTFELLRTAAIPPELAHAGEPAFDSVALDLLKGFKPPSSGGSGGSGEGALTDYCKRSIANEPGIHYSQARAMTHLGVPPENGFTADCSGHSTSSFYEAGWPDPNHNKPPYNGWGYTGTLVNNPEVGSPYKVGDLALYGGGRSSTSHVCTCYKAGDAWSSVWCSHGSEAAPCAVSLYYRDDLVCVVRPAKS